ncbi:MAG: NAD(P)/FAD-dependent oxidoreductase [Bacteriovoracaceae bacterium]
MSGVIPTYEGNRVYTSYKSRKSDNFDVIVIGSGMGGMSAASALSQLGKRVCVLERHSIPGGFTHMFLRNGFSFDAGVHAVGEMDAKKGASYRMLNYLSGGKHEIKMNSLGENYEEMFFPGNFSIKFPNTPDKFRAALVEKFPNEVAAIDAYFALCKEAIKTVPQYMAFKSMPLAVGKTLEKLYFLFKKKYWQVTTEAVLNSINASKKLQTVLTAQWGYYGSLPSESPFLMHALIYWHFRWGAYYPVGGSKEIAANILNVVLKNGGEVLCQSNVKEVILEGNKATGVELADGTKLYAPIIISAAGAKTTVNKLLPQTHQNSWWTKEIKKLESSFAYICLNLGFEGDISKVGASKTNWWLFETWDEYKYWDPTDKNSIPEILYISFPSLKDPLHKTDGDKVQHTGEVVTFVPYKIFEKWNKTTRKNREQDYLEFKQEITERILKQMRLKFPELMKLLVFSELSTPLTAEHYVNVDSGAIYGLAATVPRFTSSALRPRTPIKGFYLTGVDTVSCGVAGAMNSGILTAAAIDSKVIKNLRPN